MSSGSGRSWAAAFALTVTAVLLVGGKIVEHSQDRGPSRQLLHSGLLTAAPACAGETPSFQATIAGAIARMHADMRIAPTKDSDAYFARMMIAHHQGAIDMAIAELRYGRDEQVRRLAQQIIIEQRQEIELMNSLLGKRVVGTLSSSSDNERDAGAEWGG